VSELGTLAQVVPPTAMGGALGSRGFGTSGKVTHAVKIPTFDDIPASLDDVAHGAPQPTLWKAKSGNHNLIVWGSIVWHAPTEDEC
jgi:hypothetical protein